MSHDDLKEDIISYIKDYSQAHGKPPTISSICSNVQGVNRSNFYQLFSGIGEACDIAGIDIPVKRIESTSKAIRSRKTPKYKLPQITINEKSSAQIQTISYIENVTPQEIIDKLIENDRILKKEFNLNINDISRLASFLKSCELNNVNKNRIINSLKTFTNLSLDLLPSNNFNLLISLWKGMLINHWSFEDIKRHDMNIGGAYNLGYSTCLEKVSSTIRNETKTIYGFNSLPRSSILDLIGKVILSLDAQRTSLK